MRCQNDVISRSKLLKNVYKLDQTLRKYDDDHLIYIVLYGSEKFNFNLNKEIIRLTVSYLKDTERFSFETSIVFFCFFFGYYYHYHYYFIALRRWFLTYIYSNIEDTFFWLSNLELFIESLYASSICLRLFFIFLNFLYIHLLLILLSLLIFTYSLRAQAVLRNV